MDKKLRLLITLVIIIVLVVGFYFLARTVTSITGKSIVGWVGKVFK